MPDFGSFNPFDAVANLVATGGSILWGILVVSLLLWTLILERYWFFMRIYPRQLKALVDSWNQRQERASWFAHRIRDAMISQANSQLRMTLPVIQTLITICPLMGLLGTVTGMIGVFDVMALKGTSDARAMASGVFQATVPTMAGMVVALSGLYFNSRFRQVVRVETERLADVLQFQTRV